MPRCGVYSLARDYHPVSVDPNDETSQPDPRDNVYAMDPYWAIAVIRLGEPLSFNRKTMSSDSNDLTGGALLRAKTPLVITSDCFRISVSNHKSNHMKKLSFTLHATNVNYFIEVLPDDWVFAWMMNNREDYLRVVNNIDQISMNPSTELSVNDFNDGLKFVGRVDDVFKDTSVVDPDRGTKASVYNISCTGFRELDTQMFYDPALATSDAQGGNFGWMARFGVSTDALFGSDAARGVKENNINQIIPTLLDLIVGHGPPASSNISVGKLDQNPQAGARARASNDPGFSYLVPVSVANILKKSQSSKGVTSYADIMELWTGVQSYESKSGKTMFTPTFKGSDQQNRKITSAGELLGTFLPFTLDFANRPLWSIFQQYVNPAINELYTALKVNDQGRIVPTVVFRQIPFTTDALMLPTDSKETGQFGPLQPGAADEFVKPENSAVKVTKFLDLPRWHIPAAIVKRAHVGRSNATRTNFVHVYGSTTYTQNGGIPIQYQMLTNPPVRDDVDIFRSGIRSYMTTVDCWVDDTVGKAPGKWMALIADWMMGSHLTFSGTIDCFGIQAPIAEGDNVSFDGVVYHVMGVDHHASIDPGGNKTWGTTLQVTNGMRDISNTIEPAFTKKDVRGGAQPIYPGINVRDNSFLDPGLTVEHEGTTGDSTSWGDDPKELPTESPLDPSDGSDPGPSSQYRTSNNGTTPTR